MRILNLYAGVGGNRALWPLDAEVTAVELDTEIAQAYVDLWPGDTVIVGDAHQYLLDHLLGGWDFIWSSPPCPTHSKLNAFSARKGQLRYPDLDRLYGEIILLRHRAPAGTRWCVENVIPYYTPLIPPTAKLGRHFAWGNFKLPQLADTGCRVRTAAEVRGARVLRMGAYRAVKPRLGAMDVGEASDFEQAYGLRLPRCAETWGRQKRRQVMRNCVDPAMGLAVWNAAFNRDCAEQGSLFAEVAA